jgi:hypothetical protein
MTPAQRIWKREVIHQVIRTVMKPIECVMKHGIILPCADGNERLCFPILCQHIGDMEEQWLLTLTISPTCPKCYHRGTDVDYEDMDIELEWREEGDTSVDVSKERTDEDAFQCRLRYSTDSNFPLKALGFHPESPYSHNYPYGGILDAVGPDLLHQISKCWKDYAIDDWFWPLMLGWWRNKTPPVYEATLKLEFDSRFCLIPTFPGCRRFPDGIMNKNHTWAVFELRSMMKMIVPILDGICPPQAMVVMRDYLHMHMLSHYEIHTDESLDYLEDAINVFFRNLRDPHGIFVQNGLITPNYEPQKLHYFHHYPNSVRSKGSLTAYSTDRTEIWHKPLKRAYERSNKKEDDAYRFILKEQATLEAFQKMVDDRQLDSRNELENQTKDSDLDGEGDCSIDDFNESTVAKIGSTTYVWPKTPRFPARLASRTQKDLKLARFQQDLTSFLRKDSSISNSAMDLDPPVLIFNSVKISYPSWIDDEVGIKNTDELQNVNEARTPVPAEYIVPSSDSMITTRINANDFYRHETVLVKFDQSASRIRNSNLSTMLRRRVAQTLLLFKCLVDGTEFELAYVNWFETVRAAKDTDCGLFLLKRTSRCSVILISDIERPVHLVPKFGNQLDRAAMAKQAMDKAREADKAMRNAKQLKGTKTWNATDFILNYYSEFWLNVWVDRHGYKTIY